MEFTVKQPEYFPQQKVAIRHLSRDSPVTQLLYGGAASGGKSFLIQDWQIRRRLFYPKTRGFIARSDLGDLRKFTIPEIIDMMDGMRMKRGVDWTYNGQDMFIEFHNGSRLYFVDLYAYPMDPDFKRLGSTAYTDGAIEEAAEITEKGVNIMRSRIRYKLTEFCNCCGAHGLNSGIVSKLKDDGGPLSWICPTCTKEDRGLIPKMLMTCNPDTGHLRQNFHNPWEMGTLPETKAFVPSLATDNPHTPQSYIDALNDLPEMDRKRLLLGDWNYDTSADTMFQYGDIMAAFNDVPGSGEFYITADIARLGKDRTIICVWHGLTVVEVVKMERQRLDAVCSRIRELMEKHGVKIRNVIVDEDGIGGGVVDSLKCRGFTNGATSTQPKLYTNIKHECYFKLADYFEKAKVSIRLSDQDPMKTTVIKELQAIRRKAPDGDTKLKINSKDEQKKLLNDVSPDFPDALMMRMYFDLRPGYGVYNVAGV